MIVLHGKPQIQSDIELAIQAVLIKGESPRSAKGISQELGLPVKDVAKACDCLWRSMLISKDENGNYFRDIE